MRLCNRRIFCFLHNSIKAKDFAAEMTSVNVQTKDLQGETRISQEHIANNAAVRDMLVQRGIVPEAFLQLNT
jgi:DNA-damage-inducible protein D